MYTSINFKTKKALKDAIVSGAKITIYQPNNIFNKSNPSTGIHAVEGPWYPAPHTWYAQVTLENGFVIKVK